MSDFSIRQGTVYQEKGTENRILLINHDVMNMKSIAVPGNAQGFDYAHIAFISVDDIITLRKGGMYDDLGDVPPEIFKQIVNAILANVKGLDENTKKLLSALIAEKEQATPQ